MAFDWTDPSWTNARRNTVEGATDRILRMFTRSYLSVQAVTRDDEARAAYILYFNDPGLTQLGHVQNIVRDMHDRVAKPSQVVQMIYVPTLAAFTALGVGALPMGVSFDNVEAFVTQSAAPAATPLRLFIGPSFFTGNVYIPNALNQRTGTGTILHELSHGVGGTADQAYPWQPAYAGLTAAQRANNADSFRAYCQSFDA